MSKLNKNSQNILNTLEYNENVKNKRKKIYNQTIMKMPNISEFNLVRPEVILIPNEDQIPKGINRKKMITDLIISINKSTKDLDEFLDIILSLNYQHKKIVSKNIIFLLSELNSLKIISEKILKETNKKLNFIDEKYKLIPLLQNLSILVKTVTKNNLKNIIDINDKILVIIKLIISWYETNWKI